MLFYLFTIDIRRLLRRDVTPPHARQRVPLRGRTIRVRRRSSRAYCVVPASELRGAESNKNRENNNRGVQGDASPAPCSYPARDDDDDDGGREKADPSAARLREPASNCLHLFGIFFGYLFPTADTTSLSLTASCSLVVPYGPGGERIVKEARERGRSDRARDRYKTQEDRYKNGSWNAFSDRARELRLLKTRLSRFHRPRRRRWFHRARSTSRAPRRLCFLYLSIFFSNLIPLANLRDR